MDIKKDILTRFAIVYIVIAIFGVFIIAKIIRIQFSEGEQLKQMNISQQKASVTKPKRGDIFSKNGKVLACSVPEYVVYFDYRIPAFAKSDTLFKNNVQNLAAGLAQLFPHEGRTKKDYLDMLYKTAKSKSYVRLHKKPIDFTMLQKVKQLPILKEGPFKGGLLIDTYNSRVYPYGDMARRTIGLLRKGSFHGETGLELYYDSYLYGIEKTAQSLDPALRDKENATIDGYDIVTTLDTEIQTIANEELLKALHQYKALWGCAIVMEVKTGEILALSNLSRNTNPADSNYYEIENFAVDYRCDPGSTIKLPSMMIALEDGYVSLEDTVDTGNGLTRFYGLDVVDWNHKTHGGFHRLSVKDVFANSSNVGVTKIIHANYVATKKEWDYIQRLQNMGLNSITGVDLKNERTPLVKDPSMTTKHDKQKWYKTSLISMSYGYEIELTPLQVLNFYNAVANDGKLLQPYLVKEVRSDAKTILKNQTKVLKQSICSKSTLQKAKVILEAVVETGTAKALKNPYFKIAGKTGTAQTIVGNRYDDKMLRGSFCGYFPADNPKYSCIIVMQSSLPYDPYRVSGTNTAHVFKKIADRIYFADHELRNQLSTDTSVVMTIPKLSNGYANDYAKIFSSLGIAQQSKPASKWVRTVTQEASVDYLPLSIEHKVVPSLFAMGMRDAVYAAEKAGLRVECRGYGRLVRQSIPAGVAIKNNETIILEFN